MATHNGGTYLYLLKEREHIRCNDTVYKVGFTTDFGSRMRAYPNGSAVIISLRIQRNAGRQAERLALAAFERCFTHRRDIGAEYFDGDVVDMAAMLISVASRFVCAPEDDASDDADDAGDAAGDDAGDDAGDTPSSTEESVDESSSPAAPSPAAPAPPPDAMQIVLEFIRPRLAGLSGRDDIAADSLYAELVANAGHHRACPQLAMFISLVRKMFGATCRNMELYFPAPICIIPPEPSIDPPAIVDPRHSKVAEFIEARIDFMPRRTPEHAGKKYFAWIPEKDVVATFWTWYRDYNHYDNSDFFRSVEKLKNTKTAWKAVIKAVMLAKGRMLRTIRPVVGGSQIDVVAYDRVAWKSA
jgi:hypothetical protein